MEGGTILSDPTRVVKERVLEVLMVGSSKECEVYDVESRRGHLRLKMI